MRSRMLSLSTLLGALLLVGCSDSIAPAGSGEDLGLPLTVSGPEPDSPSVVYLARADGSAAVALTEGAWPAWSPDGTRIAFHRASRAPTPPRDRARDGELYITGVDGTGERLLGHGVEPVWSPDGEWIAFADGEGIAVVRPDGSGRATLVRHGFLQGSGEGQDLGVGKPAWSPDGSRIAFEHRGDGEVLPAQIYVMGADGSEPTRLTPKLGMQYAESDPTWSPDGSRIAFWSFGYGIALAPATGGAPETMLRDFPTVAYGARPAWSPETGTIAFAARVGGATEIWTLGARPLLRPAAEPAWSPDGTRLAFVRARD